MAQVEIRINRRAYRISCDDGQEEHLTRLAAFVDKRVQELVASVGQVGEERLLVMASLLIADELSETFASIEAGQDGGDDGSVKTIEAAAERIERIAAKLTAA
jgi:cell division protein ZapA